MSGDEYGYSERRKTKKDLRRKRRERVYKQGGSFRTSNVKETGKK
jgi:hypothetical protein